MKTTLWKIKHWFFSKPNTEPPKPTVHYASKPITVGYVGDDPFYMKDYSLASQMELLGYSPRPTALRMQVPALNERVKCPLRDCMEPATLWSTIQHVNDQHQWSREKIADWIETLDLDIEFKIGEDHEQD